MADDWDEARERVLAVLYELPGPDGFAGTPAGRIRFGDALDELADLDGPTSLDAAGRAFEARLADRVRRDGGDGR